MDKAIAKQVAETSIIPSLNSACDAEEYAGFAKTIKSIAGLAATDILHKIFAIYPDIEKEIDDQITRFVRLD